MSRINARSVLDVVKRVDGSSEVVIRARGKDYAVKGCWADATACLPGRRKIILEPLFPDEVPKDEPVREQTDVVSHPAPSTDVAEEEPVVEEPNEEQEPDEEPEPEPIRRRPGRPRKE